MDQHGYEFTTFSDVADATALWYPLNNNSAIAVSVR